MSRFHSTLNALRGILAWETATGGSVALREARRDGLEYLLKRRLMFRRSTSEPVGSWVTRVAYPFRSYYSVLNVLDYVRAASLHDGSAPDARAADAIDVLRSKRQPDGTWRLEYRHPGRSWFETDAEPGQPSKWVTFYATRVLDWWDRATASSARAS